MSGQKHSLGEAMLYVVAGHEQVIVQGEHCSIGDEWVRLESVVEGVLFLHSNSQRNSRVKILNHGGMFAHKLANFKCEG